MSDSFERTLDLMAEVRLEPGVADVEMAREQRETLGPLGRLEDQLAQRAFMLFQETEFETHPYRVPLIEAITPADRLRVAQRVLRLDAYTEALIRA